MTPQTRVSQNGGLAAAAAVGAVAVWSTNALAAGAALEQLTVLQVLALQFGAGTAVLGLARCARSARRGRDGAPGRRLTRQAVTVAVVGLAGTIALQYLAFATAPLVAANAIAYAWPLMVAAWTALVDRRGSRAPLAFALVGFAGVVLIFVQRGGGDSPAATAPLLGYAAALGSALTMAWYTLAVGRLAARRIDLLLIATVLGATITAPAAIWQGTPWATSSPAIVFGLYTGLGPMAVGYALWTHAMAHPTGARLAPVAYGTPLLSTLVLLAAGAQLPPLALVGCALIVICAAGVVIDTRTCRGSSHDQPRRMRTNRGRDKAVTAVKERHR